MAQGRSEFHDFDLRCHGAAVVAATLEQRGDRGCDGQ